MKFAIVHGVRSEAQHGLAGECFCCGGPTISRCGDVRVWHWAHKGRRMCDLWWENETDWHRRWKNEFPVDWQEVVHRAEDGERHIADVKTPDGWVLEFQHSYITSDERRSRETFYQSLIWVVDGTRRGRDWAQFAKSVSRGSPLIPFSATRRIPKPAGAIVRDWSGSAAHVFFDFGSDQQLWWLFPGSNEERAYVHPLGRDSLLTMLRESGWREFESQVSAFSALIARLELPPATRSPVRPAAPSLHPGSLPPRGRHFRF